MSEENVEMIRRAYEAFNRGDLDAGMAYLAPTFEYVATGAVPDAGGTFRGPEGYRRFVELWWNEFDNPNVEVHELIEAGEQVLASLTFRGRGKQSGVESGWHFWIGTSCGTSAPWPSSRRPRLRSNRRFA